MSLILSPVPYYDMLVEIEVALMWGVAIVYIFASFNDKTPKGTLIKKVHVVCVCCSDVSY